MSRAVVNVASDSWVRGQERLVTFMLASYGEQVRKWTNCFPPGCPKHRTRGALADLEDRCRPYAFKAYALQDALDRGGFSTLLWCDASIVPVRNLTPLWERIERDGYWIARNGWNNAEWTADAAYPDLFPQYFGKTVDHTELAPEGGLEMARALNQTIPHVVGTAFGLDASHPVGKLILHEYFRLASQTRAFCGPWGNSKAPHEKGRNSDRIIAECGPYPPVLGHRHDQTALSVIAWRLKCQLDQTGTFAYEGGETADTILVAKGI